MSTPSGRTSRKTAGKTTQPRKTTRRSSQVTRQSQPDRNSQTTKRTRVEDFTPADRIKAVTAALTANSVHPVGKRAYDAACASLGVNINVGTLHDWLKLYRAQVEPTLALTVVPVEETILAQRDKTLNDMVKAKEIAMAQLLDEGKAKLASYRDSGVVMGILHDKIEASTALPVSMVNAVQAFMRICDALGLPAEDMIRGNTAKLIGVQQHRLMQDNQGMLTTGDNDATG